MGKLKSHSGAKKRLRRTGSGKLTLKRNSRGHLLQQKAANAKRKNRTLLVHKRDEKRMSALVPYL